MARKITVTFEGDNVLFNDILVGHIRLIPATEYRGAFYNLFLAREIMHWDSSPKLMHVNGVEYQLAVQYGIAGRQREKVEAHVMRYRNSISKHIHAKLRELGGF